MHVLITNTRYIITNVSYFENNSEIHNAPSFSAYKMTKVYNTIAKIRDPRIIGIFLI